MKLNLIFILFAIAVSTACESNLTNFEIKKKDPKINAIAFAEADSFPRFLIGKSFSLDQTIDYYHIKNARVNLITINDLKTSLTLNNKFFYETRALVFEEGKSYRIEIQAEGFKSAAANFVIPKKVKVLEVRRSIVDYVEKGCVGCTKTQMLKIDIDFEALRNEISYFEVEAFGLKELRLYNDSLAIQDSARTGLTELFFWSSNQNVAVTKEFGVYTNSESNLEPYGNAMYFSSEFLPVGKNTFTFRIEVNSLSGLQPEKGKDEIGFWISFNAVDEHLFDYAISKARFNSAEGNPFVEPVNVYSNVENGVGLIGGRMRNYMFEDVTQIVDSLRNPNSQ